MMQGLPSGNDLVLAEVVGTSRSGRATRKLQLQDWRDEKLIGNASCEELTEQIGYPADTIDDVTDIEVVSAETQAV